MTKEVRNVVHEGPIVAATLSDPPTRGQKSRDTTKRRERDLILLEAERVLSLVAQVIVNDLLLIPTYLILPTFFVVLDGLDQLLSFFFALPTLFKQCRCL